MLTLSRMASWNDAMVLTIDGLLYSSEELYDDDHQQQILISFFHVDVIFRSAECFGQKRINNFNKENS